MGKLGPSALIFLKLSNFIIFTYRALNFLPRMGSINSFGQTVQEILLNNYLKSNFENFLEFHKEKIFLKTILYANILRTTSDRKINEFIKRLDIPIEGH